jgi:hypothetical protein
MRTEKLEHIEPRGTFGEDAGILPLLLPKAQYSDTEMWLSKTPAVAKLRLAST